MSLWGCSIVSTFGFEIILECLGEKLHIYLVLAPDQVTDASFPVIDFDRCTLGGLYRGYSKLIDFRLNIMAAKVGNIFFEVSGVRSFG